MVEGLPYLDFAQEDLARCRLGEHLDRDRVLAPRPAVHVAEKPNADLRLKIDLVPCDRPAREVEVRTLRQPPQRIDPRLDEFAVERVRAAGSRPCYRFDDGPLPFPASSWGDGSAIVLSSVSSCPSSTTRSRARSSVLMASGISLRAIWRTSIMATSSFAASAVRMSWCRSAMSWARSCAFCAARRACSVLRTLSGSAGTTGAPWAGGAHAEGRESRAREIRADRAFPSVAAAR
jgi:hypothetical protein